MKRTFIVLVVLLFAVSSAGAKTVELVLYSSKATEAAKKYKLLPRVEKQKDLNTELLYEKAVQVLPANLQIEQIRQWLKTPLDKLTHKQVQSTLEQLKPALQMIKKASRCQQCQWSPEKREKDLNLEKYRTLAYILALKVRLQIAQGRYKPSIITIQTGICMARHMGQGHTVIHGLVGSAIASVVLEQVQELIQQPGSPNLYYALKELPRPLVDLLSSWESEIADLKSSELYNSEEVRAMLKRKSKPAHERLSLMMKIQDRRVAALQCIEALRFYAAAHDGKFPKALSEISKVKIPDDPVTGKPFIYKCSGSNAVLETAAYKGQKEKDITQYKLTIKK